MATLPHKTVTQPLHTGLDVLIKAEGKEIADLPWSEKERLVSVFTRPNLQTLTPARPITSADIEELLGSFSRKEWPLVVGVTAMRAAIGKKDEPAFLEAFEKLRPWYDTIGKTTLNIGNNWTAAQFLYAEIMNRLTQDARLIQWQPKEGLLMPALYCPDLKTAKFVLLVMGRFRVCPKCKELFRPKKGNQDYCSAAHGIAWRTAESRRRKKLREEKLRARKR